MRYAPSPSVITERVYSMSTSLDASTVTPGSTAPEVSFTWPAMALWACAAAGSQSTQAHRLQSTRVSESCNCLLGEWPDRGRSTGEITSAFEGPDGEKVSIRAGDPPSLCLIR